jgi:hypothetical protein
MRNWKLQEKSCSLDIYMYEIVKIDMMNYDSGVQCVMIMMYVDLNLSSIYLRCPGKNLRVQVCRPYLTATFFWAWSNARFSRMVPFKTQLLYNFCHFDPLKAYPWKTKNDQKMEGGIPHFQSHTEPCTGRFTKTSQGTMSGHLARARPARTEKPGRAPRVSHGKAQQSSAGPLVPAFVQGQTSCQQRFL